ncbi:MAG TPA: c-type cytochrome [Dongiaceae bacterium]|nr:c-type cytochrome [Dongiaceae bacterium]
MTKFPRSLAHVLAALLLCACGTPPGKPVKNSEVPAPNEILDFAALFGANCAGCHGENGRGGAGPPLSDPVYLAITDVKTVQKTITQGVPGTPMAPFGQSAGGMLTDKQVEVIASGIFSRWSKPGILSGVDVPAYASSSAGDAKRGAEDYKTFCETCHGSDGRGGPKGSSIIERAYLALTSNQGLRTAVIVGRPDFGAPDWRNNVPGHPMTEQQITDVVAWLAEQRPANAAQQNQVAKEQHNAK